MGSDGRSITLTKAQIDFRAEWRGAPPVIVRTPAEALRAIGAGPSQGEIIAAAVRNGPRR